MKKFDNYKSNLAVLSRAGEQDLTNEFIIGGIIVKFSLQFELGMVRQRLSLQAG